MKPINSANLRDQWFMNRELNPKMLIDQQLYQDFLKLHLEGHNEIVLRLLEVIQFNTQEYQEYAEDLQEMIQNILSLQDC